ncbi:transcriptional regulator [Lentilactobacillus senioris DSM 24302 = JCM 17472]|uniref:Transcriptional regulator n=1 Tax=Lentilactobacillus senioris DSM 24302 = JCM 17472 TaxID=1423802 RepID=A0A0R2CNS8_9LACO|nr:ROK family protein [Lentilactobacillus senioris]KRM93361.1 transcriptional regulator [Lentilactobacillus senioris DSM 24302 = JCM 17472]
MDDGLTSKQLVRQTNGKLILQNIFNSGVTSRAQIARDLSLNKSTVSSIYNDLMLTGLIKEVGDGEASNNGGRKPTMVTINATYGVTVSLDIAYRNLHYMFNYLNGEIVKSGEIRIYQRDIHEILDIIHDLIESTLPKIKSEVGLMGISISYHGIVKDGQILYSPFLNLGGIDLKQELWKMYPHVKITIDNEANMAALYERDFNDEQSTENSITISIHKGIGAGIILNHTIYRGATGEAGEVGRTLTMHNGKYQTVESICSEDAIITAISDEYGEPLFRNDVVDLYRKSNPIVIKRLDLFVETIAFLMYNIAKTFDTHSFFISSPLIEEMPEMLNAIDEQMRMIDSSIPNVYLIDDADKATLLGSCSLITHRVLDMMNYDLHFSIN